MNQDHGACPAASPWAGPPRLRPEPPCGRLGLQGVCVPKPERLRWPTHGAPATIESKPTPTAHGPTGRPAQAVPPLGHGFAAPSGDPSPLPGLGLP